MPCINRRIGIMHSTQFIGTRVPLPCLIAKGYTRSVLLFCGFPAVSMMYL